MPIAKIRKLHEDSNILIFDEIRLGSGGSLKIKNHQGFVIAEIMENGDIKSRGRKVKT